MAGTTTLFSFPKGKDTGYRVVFDWDKYQEENRLVNDVDNPTFEFTKKKSEHGIKLEMKKLNHDWNTQVSQESLLIDINLINPINKPIKEFKVVTKFNPALAVVPHVKKEFLDKAVYRLKTRLTGGNLIHYEFSSINGKKKDGNLVATRKLKCGDAVFEVYFFYKSPKYFEQAVRKEMILSESKEINKILECYSGIKLYRDNFRVKPYGDQNSDWIGLDIAAHNNSMLPRNDAIIGMVHVGKTKNPLIVDTTTREGIIYNDEFQDLIAFVQLSIQKIFADLRGEFESHKTKARKKKVKKSRKPVPVVIPGGAPMSSLVPSVFMDIGGKYPENFYNQLQEEINICYEHNHPNATFFLCRKMVENLVFNILEKKFPSRIELWYDKTNGVRLKFSKLIKNLHDERNNFGKPNIKSYIEKFNSGVGLFRQEANSKAHNIFEYLCDRNELHQFKIKDLVQLLVKIFDNI